MMLDISLQQMKSALEIARTGSISQAAKNLYMNQPNLSKSVKDMEEALGIKLFKRNAKGVSATKEGELFLRYAESIVLKMDAMERDIHRLAEQSPMFHISIPRASYITYAFTEFIQRIHTNKDVRINYQETNTMDAIENILHNGFPIGIIRYPVVFEKEFQELIEKKGLRSETIWQFRNVALLTEEDPAAEKEILTLQDLEGYTELVHGDVYVPFISKKEYNRHSVQPPKVKRIYLYERGSQFDLLRNVPSTFMWVSPLPEKILKQQGLCQKYCEENNVLYKDALICREEYVLSGLDKMFLDALFQVRDALTDI